MTTVAGTPSSFPAVVLTETLDQLEFGRVLDLVAEYAVSELGARSVRARVPSSVPDEIAEELALVAELMRAFDRGEAFAPRAVPDLSESVKTLLTDGGVLEAAALVELAGALGAMRETAAALRALRDDASRVAGLETDVPPVGLEQAIVRAIEPDGRVKDDASAALRRARRRVRETRNRLIGLLEHHRRTLATHATTGDTAVTMRGGRYVIPVRKDARSSLTGIVHGESASGATLFVEPAEAVELGNELTAYEAEEAREVLAVLRALTGDAREHLDRIEAGWDMCIRADDLYARTRYAQACEAHLPDLVADGPALSISHGVHPLILAESERAVFFDLELADGERTVVVSGPNAGGKTVLLKAVGLISAMTQAGIVPPVGRGTKLPVFRRIFSDIGDHQSIAASLSTFSAHVAALKEILVDADEGALVLLDELGGGTDPLEGAALAGGVILSLNGRRAITIATTHLGELKELAAGTDGVVNASMEFDGDTLAPTYRFAKGKPGRSYALAIASRLGMPADVMATAESLTPDVVRSLEATLAELEKREANLERREHEVSDRDRDLMMRADAVGSEREKLDLLSAELAEREVELERSGREQARKFLLEARRRVEDALGLARAAVSEATAKEARRLVEDGVRAEGDALDKLAREAASKGWKVKGAGGKGEGERGKQRGTAEPRCEVAVDEPRRGIADVSDLGQPASHELDLRGLRAEEAETRLMLAIDAAVVADLPYLRIIHGKGTGALKAVVADLLRRDPRVGSARLAEPQHGGTGVTIAELRL